MWKRRLFWGVWLLVAILLYFFENNSGTRALLLVSAVLPAGSIVCAVLSQKRLTHSFCMPKECKKNAVVECDVRVKGLLPCALFYGCVEALNRLTAEKTLLEVWVSAFSDKKAFSLSTSHCGTINISIAEGYVQDWFGLWRSSPVRYAPEYLTVLPDIFLPEVTIADGESAFAEGERWSATRSGSDPSETFAIREYMQGDPIRQIHWKLSQKTGTTMLRELGLSTVEQTILLLDTTMSERGIDAAAMSAAVETIISLSYALTAAKIVHSVGWKNRILDELELYEIHTEPKYALMCERILTASCAFDNESICACFQKWSGGNMYAHTVICAPTPPPDIVSICTGGRVMLLLSGGKLFDAALGDIHVTTYCPENAGEELKYIKI